MRPYLFKIPIPFLDKEIPVHGYGFMLAMGFLLAILLVLRLAKKQGENEDHVYNLAYWVVISSILGSRIFHCIVEWELYAGQPWRAFYVWEGGLVYYGGLIGALIASSVYVRIYKINFFKWADMAAPGIALGLVFGRLGCFMVGCCHGKVCPADYWGALTFPPESVGDLNGLPLYPTQLWALFANLGIFLFLYFVVLPRKKFHGQVLGIFLVIYSFTRSIIEFWRADHRGFVDLFTISGPAGATTETTTGLFSKLLFFEALLEKSPGIFSFRISESQFVSIFAVVFVLIFFFVQAKRAPVQTATEKTGPKNAGSEALARGKKRKKR